MSRKWLVSAIAAASLALVTTASAQYGGMGGMGGTMGGSPTSATPTYAKKSYGVNKAAMAAVIGGGVAGGALLLRHFRHQRTLTACVGSDGSTLDDGKDIYTLLGSPLPPGERLVADGKKMTSDSGAPAFEVTYVRKDLGRCEQQTTASVQP